LFEFDFSMVMFVAVTVMMTAVRVRIGCGYGLSEHDEWVWFVRICCGLHKKYGAYVSGCRCWIKVVKLDIVWLVACARGIFTPI
jgi:hypothetical protein